MPHPTRHFIDWHLPLLPAAAALLARSYADTHEIALGRVAVVLPGARAGRRLKELLLAEADTLNLPLSPPRVLTVRQLSTMLTAAELPSAEGILARRAWAVALREREEELAIVFPNLPASDDLVALDLLASRLHSLSSELAGEGHRFRDVAAAGGADDLLFDDSGRWEALAHVQMVYEARVAAMGCSDPDLARMESLRKPLPDSLPAIWLLGIVELPGVVKRLLARCPEGQNVVIHAPESEAEGFDAFGCLVPERWLAREIPLSESDLVMTDGPSEQAAAVAMELACLGDAASLEDVTIAVPDTRIVPFLEQRLAASGVPSRFGAGTPLPSTRPYRLLQAIADYLDTRRWEEFASLVRHPDLPLDGSPQIWRFDEYHSERLPLGLQQVPGSEDPATVALLKCLRALHDSDLLGQLTGRARLSEWASPIMRVLLRCYGDRKLSRDQPGERALLGSLERLRAAAAVMDRLPAGADDECDSPAAIRLLLNSVGGDSVADEPDRPAVELLGWLEMRPDEAPVAIVTGFNEPHLPESLSADAFLPDGMRRHLGLLDNARRYARDAYELTAILHSRSRVRLITGRMDAEGNPLRPSRLMLACSGATLAERVARFARPSGEQVHPAPVLRPGSPKPGFPLPPEPVLKLDPPDSVSVTALGLLLTDPYAYALKHRLRLGSAGDEGREMDPLTFGNVAHAVLQRFGHLPEARSSDASVVFGCLSKLLDEEQESRFGGGTMPAVTLQMEQLRQRLRAFSLEQAGMVAEGWETVLVEGAPAGQPTAGQESPLGVELVVDGEPMRVTGRIDRIDRHKETGAWRLLDYKIGDSATSPEERHLARGKNEAGEPIREWVDLQLPIYRRMAMVMEVDGERLMPPNEQANIAVGYLLLPKTLEETGLSLAEWSEDDFAAADEAAQRAIRTLRTGVFTYDPSGRSSRWMDDFESLLGLRVVGTAVDPEEEEEVVAR